jgi:hypothetical protein
MFKLIKFLLIILLLLWLGYVANYFYNIKPSDKEQLKEQAILAIKSEDMGIFFGDLREKMTADFLYKKDRFFEYSKEKLKAIFGK